MKTAAPGTLHERPLLSGAEARWLAFLPGLLRVQARRLHASPMGCRVAGGAFWSLTGAAVARLLGLMSSIVVARWVGTQAFGELGIIQGTVGMFGVLAGLGLGLTATKHIAEFRESDPARAGRILAMSTTVAMVSGLVMALMLVAASGWLARHTLAAPHLSGLLRISSVLIFLGAWNGAQLGALSGFEAFRVIARVSLISGIASLPLMVVGVWAGGLTGAVWGLVAAQGVNCIFNHQALRAEAVRAGVALRWRARDGIAADEWGVLLEFSLPAMLCSAMILPVNWAGMALLVQQPDGYEQMGLFNAANQWRTAILFVPQALASVALPALAGIDPIGHARRYGRLLWGNAAAVGTIALLLALLVIGGSGWILRSYGHDFEQGRATLVFLALAAVVMAINQVLGADVIRQGRMWAGLICNATWAAIFLGLAWRLVPTLGARGLALAILGSYPVHTVCLLVLSLRGRPRGEAGCGGSA